MKMSFYTKLIVGWVLAMTLLIVAAAYIPVHAQEVEEFDANTVRITTVQDLRNLRMLAEMGDPMSHGGLGGYLIGTHEFLIFTIRHGTADAASHACAAMPTVAFANLMRDALNNTNKYPGELPMLVLIGTACQEIAVLLGTAPLEPV